MPYATANDVPVYYAVDGAGPALAFCHGSGGRRATWWKQIARFRDRYRAIALDFPGFGNSGSGPETWDAHAYPDATVAGLDGAVLIGQSLGRAAALAVLERLLSRRSKRRRRPRSFCSR